MTSEQRLAELSDWFGWETADLVSIANNRCLDQLNEPALWSDDPDLALEIADWLDADSLLELGGCLDANT